VLYAVVDEELPLEALNETNEKLSGMLRDLRVPILEHIPANESLDLPIPGELEPGQVLVYRFEVEDPEFPEQPMIDFGQHEMERPAAPAARWHYHQDHECDGDLTVWGTINCDRKGPPLFEGYIKRCQSYSGILPTWANDYEINFAADYPEHCDCNNRTEQYKVVIKRYTNQWEMVPLSEWVASNLTPEDPIVLPVIGDMRAAGERMVRVAVNLNDWLADPPRLRDTYAVIGGRNPELPGFQIGIGAEPIIFDPCAPPDADPLIMRNLLPFGEVQRLGTLTIHPDCDIRADLNENGRVEYADFSIFADSWLRSCRVIP
jgi:hypothetical protein